MMSFENAPNVLAGQAILIECSRGGLDCEYTSERKKTVYG
jgi:hypothetical protein